MPESSLDRLFLDCSIERLRLFASRIGCALDRLTDEQVWLRGGENQNAVANLVLHLCGNVRQWIIAGVGGAPDIRRRDEEFAAHGGVLLSVLRERLESTVTDAVAAIERLSAERLAQRLQIQTYDVTVLEAVYHVVEHFSMHTGQILFATKMLTGEGLGFYRHLQGAPRPPQA